jgi:transglutaminase-like putative cysteine protease
VGLGVSLSARPPETVALLVRLGAPLAPSSYPRYWRARVLNVYTGRSWWANARVGALPAADPELTAPYGAVVQEIELVSRDTPLLVALPDVVAFDVPTGAERLPDGTLAAVTAELTERRYRAVSRPQELAPLPATTPQGAPSGPLPGQESLGLPAGVPARVRDLARSVAGEAGNQLEQALALEAYLRGLPYAYEVQPIPAGGDAVDQFLFTMRQGYCTYYASAMAVMARSLGIPARVAVGYATGTYDEALGAYVVREADAHAWPELLIDGRWLPFEPTPALPLPERSTTEPGPPPIPSAVPEARQPTPRGGLLPAAGWVGALVLVLVALGVGRLVWARRLLTPLARAQLGLERFGARAGVPWPAGATLHEYGRLLAARGLGGDAIAELVVLIEAACYAGRPLTEAQLRRLQNATRALRAAPRRPDG